MTEAAFNSCIYEGRVHHRRVKPKRHDLTYSVYTLCIDLDELPALDRSLPGFGHNRGAPVSVHDKDHGPRDGSPLKPWVEAQVKAAGADITGGRVDMVCYPRVLGYGFNPLTEYFCFDADGRLAVVIHEVKNTFGQQHCYVIPAPAPDARGMISQTCQKGFYVSPFIEMDMTYQFTIAPPGEQFSIAIKESDPDGALLHASFTGVRRALSGRSLAATFWRYPFLTAKIIGGIHFEALRLWRKGVTLVQRPPEPEKPVTVVVPMAAE